MKLPLIRFHGICKAPGTLSMEITRFSITLQLKKEVKEAHDELRALYEDLRSSHDSLDSIEVEELDPDSDFKPGCLTTFVKSFRDVLEEMISDNSTRATVSNSAIAFRNLFHR